MLACPAHLELGNLGTLGDKQARLLADLVSWGKTFLPTYSCVLSGTFLHLSWCLRFILDSSVISSGSDTNSGMFLVCFSAFRSVSKGVQVRGVPPALFFVASMGQSTSVVSVYSRDYTVHLDQPNNLLSSALALALSVPRQYDSHASLWLYDLYIWQSLFPWMEAEIAS